MFTGLEIIFLTLSENQMLEVALQINTLVVLIMVNKMAAALQQQMPVNVSDLYFVWNYTS